MAAATSAPAAARPGGQVVEHGSLHLEGQDAAAAPLGEVVRVRVVEDVDGGDLADVRLLAVASRPLSTRARSSPKSAVRRVRVAVEVGARGTVDRRRGRGDDDLAGLDAAADAAARPDADQAPHAQAQQLLDHDGHAGRAHAAGLDADRHALVGARCSRAGRDER